MTTRLSLTIDEEVAKKVKAIAKKKNMSVSALAQQYFVRLLESESADKKPSLMALAGIVKNKNVSDEDLDKIKEEYLRKKYGL
ncbi:MAG: ribbon-helix-helix protein, CopG family [Flavisolibacter sp.]|nr:ribbon-helix-helix protein, CopG family [Flavisolibacter sp.]MBD0368075.1 ribbon-helix-helix protein, CopG family [Flavisolibacter sp.]MBD0378341.1 ribbon-helix-helix protein, CopG family [Flavisolibacter sp.]